MSMRQSPGGSPRADNNGDEAFSHAPATGFPDKIPDQWLKQIRDAIKAEKGSPFATLLGSALVAALIGAGASIGTAYLTIKANADEEIEKAQIADWQSDQKSMLQSYDALEARLNDLSSAYSGLASFVHIEQGSLDDANIARNVHGQLDRLGVTIGTVIALHSDHNIDAKLWTDIDRPIGEIRDAIVRSESKLADFPKDADTINADLKKATEEIQTAASAVKPKPPGGMH